MLKDNLVNIYCKYTQMAMDKESLSCQGTSSRDGHSFLLIQLLKSLKFFEMIQYYCDLIA